LLNLGCGPNLSHIHNTRAKVSTVCCLNYPKPNIGLSGIWQEWKKVAREDRNTEEHFQNNAGPMEMAAATVSFYGNSSGGGQI
jgi:hypothetical protein